VALDAAVSIHGTLAAHREAADVRARVLVCHGSADPHVPNADVVAFAEEMNRAGADWRLVMYGGAMHGFTHRHAVPGATPGRSDRTWTLRPAPGTAVKLLGSRYLDTMRRTVAYLKFVDADRLLHMFRVTAGLPSAAEPRGGWEAQVAEREAPVPGRRGRRLRAQVLLRLRSV
jgi:acetyl esterase/lipase